MIDDQRLEALLRKYTFAPDRPMSLPTEGKTVAVEWDDLLELMHYIEQQKKDASRWRSFLKAARYRLLGTAGFERDSKRGSTYRHFGMEFWTDYRAADDVEMARRMEEGNKEALEILTEFADTLRDRYAGK